MKTRKNIFEGTLLRGAFAKTGHEILVSGSVLVAITGVLSFLMFFAEHSRNPLFGVWDALVWIVVKYVGDPADIVNPPETIVGKFLGTLVGVMSVAIVAIPAGLFGAGFIDAMKDTEREKELYGFRNRLEKAFRPFFDATFREYYENHKSEIRHDYKGVKFVPNTQSLVNLQSVKGIDTKDIIDTCRRFPEIFRLVNLAKADAMENQPTDRLCVECFPSNRIYGCYIDRNSKVTIVCPTACSEIGMGWFTFYLAKMGGFNYISKELEAEPDEKDSFFNMSNEITYEGEGYGKEAIARLGKKDAKKEILQRKAVFRETFLNDLKKLTSGEQSWAIVFAMHIKNKSNSTDLHFSHALKDGSNSTVNPDMINRYNTFYNELKTLMKEEYGLESSDPNSVRYRLEQRNIAYRIHGNNPDCNVFALRPSIQLINLGSNKLLIAFRMAQMISEAFDGNRGILEKDLDDLKSGRCGYYESKEAEV